MTTRNNQKTEVLVKQIKTKLNDAQSNIDHDAVDDIMYMMDNNVELYQYYDYLSRYYNKRIINNTYNDNLYLKLCYNVVNNIIKSSSLNSCGYTLQTLNTITRWQIASILQDSIKCHYQDYIIS